MSQRRKNLKTVVSTLPNFISAIVVIDDASTDNTAKEMKRLSKNDKVIPIFHKKTKLSADQSHQATSTAKNMILMLLLSWQAMVKWIQASCGLNQACAD